MQEKKTSALVRAIRDDSLIRLTEEIADRRGTPLFLVGGWIRDRLLGESSRDYDFVLEGDVAAFAEGVSRRLGASCFRMGHENPPNYRIAGPAFTLDVVPQHPEGLEQELLRRDFTMNAIAFSFAENRILDPLGGYRDIQNRMVRVISAGVLDADPLRMLRAVRFVTVLKGFQLSERTVSEIRKRPERLSAAASERVREEMDRIMVSGRAREGLTLMGDLGLLRVVFPELYPLSALEQGPYHHLNGFDHTLQVVRETDDLDSLTGIFEYAFKLDQEDRAVLSYAALLHDIGKARSRTLDPEGTPHFYGHEKVGAESAAKVMKRLCFSSRRAERIKHLILYHVLGLGLIQSGYTRKALRRILRRLGEDLPLHVLLSLSDRRSARGIKFSEMQKRTVALGQALLDLYAEEGKEILHPPKFVSGRDVMEILGVAPGRIVGEVLDQVRGLQVDQVIRSREEALSFLHRLHEDPAGPTNTP